MFKVEAVGPPERCPECGFDKLYKHSSRNQLIMDLPIRLKRVGLQLNRRRYKCRECGSTFWERLISVDEKRSMTKRLLKSIQEQSMSKTFVEVAESVGVDEKTIRNVFKDYVALKEREYQFETPKWLGIDEIHIIRRPRLVLTNIERRTIMTSSLTVTRKQSSNVFQKSVTGLTLSTSQWICGSPTKTQ